MGTLVRFDFLQTLFLKSVHLIFLETNISYLLNGLFVHLINIHVFSPALEYKNEIQTVLG